MTINNATMIRAACFFLPVFSRYGYTHKPTQPGEPGAIIDSLVNTSFKQNERRFHTGCTKGEHRLPASIWKCQSWTAGTHAAWHGFQDWLCRKRFTAIAILQLVEQGKIALQDSIQQYIPFPSKGHTITIENLLTHTSGIIDYANADTSGNPYIEREDFSPQRIIPYFSYQPLEFEPEQPTTIPIPVTCCWHTHWKSNGRRLPRLHAGACN